MPHSQPSACDPALLGLGTTTGALVVHTGAERDDLEIELSPGGPNANAPRRHRVVHADASGGVDFTAVFPRLENGEYTVWRNSWTVADTIRVRGGQVTDYELA